VTPTSPADGLRALASPVVEAAGLVLEDIVVTPAGRRRLVRVIVDLPEHQVGGVPMESVAAASHAVSAALDTSDVMGGSPYVLEVSSPGVERPLTLRRHWARARERLVRVTLAGGGTATGRLSVVDDEGIVVGDVRRTWAQVTAGRIELEFTPRPGAVAQGADDLDDTAEDDLDADDDTADDTEDDTEDDTDDPDDGEVP
jgi:ribosome maturation factor RimP